MTPKEVREHILGLKTGLATAEANLANLREDRALDAEVFKGFERALAGFDKRLALLGRDAESRGSREAEVRSLRVGFWIAVFSAVASFVGSLVVAYFASRMK